MPLFLFFCWSSGHVFSSLYQMSQRSKVSRMSIYVPKSKCDSLTHSLSDILSCPQIVSGPLKTPCIYIESSNQIYKKLYFFKRPPSLVSSNTLSIWRFREMGNRVLKKWFGILATCDIKYFLKPWKNLEDLDFSILP